jgi:hypothetical protein
MNWHANCSATNVSGTATNFATNFAQNGGKTVTLAFATGECGQETGRRPRRSDGHGEQGTSRPSGRKGHLVHGRRRGLVHLRDGCGMNVFLDRWAGPNLIGVDFDIEAGQSTSVIEGSSRAFVQRTCATPDSASA